MNTTVDATNQASESFCFAAAALFVLSGVCLGIWMGMHEDFTPRPSTPTST